MRLGALIGCSTSTFCYLLTASRCLGDTLGSLDLL